MDFTDPYAIEQKRAQAALLRAQEDQEYQAPSPVGMAGRVYVGTHPFQHMAQMLRSYKGAQKEKEATTQLQDIGARKNQAIADALRQSQDLMTGKPAGEERKQMFVADDAGGGEMTMGSQATPAVAPDFRAANMALINAPDPELRRMGLSGLQNFYKEESAKNAPATVARVVETVDQKTGRPVQQQFDARGNPVGEPIPVYIPPPVRSGGGGSAPPPPKPLPPSVLKIQDDAIQKIGISGSINADLKGIEDQISSGKLSFGPVSNIVGAGLNMAGISTEQSRNFASFKSTLERLRNESLRLNTGVQTDGDAQRAWNELFQNINDTELVKQRLQEIQRINARGAELQSTRLNSARREYGFDPYDTTSLQNQPSSIATPNATRPGPTPQNAAPRGRIRFDAQGNIIP